MNFSRHFFIVTGCILLIGVALYFIIVKGLLFDHAQAENLSPLDSYLSQNFSFTLNLPKRTEDAVRIYCDPLTATSTDETVTIAYPCQNQNPAHKVVIGWARSNQSFISIMTSLGHEQLYWKYYPYARIEGGNLTCTQRADYGNYKDAIYGLDCINVTEDGEKLFSSTIFFKSNISSVHTFISVLNTVKSTSPEKVERELLTLRSKQGSTTKLEELVKTVLPEEKPLKKENNSASTTVSYSLEASAGISKSLSSNTITANTGNNPDASVCDITDMTSCYPLYCESLTSVWNFSLNRCVEPDNIDAIATLGEKKCESSTSVWDGSKCREFEGNIISSNSCLIPPGANTCTVDVFWSIQYPKSDVEIRHPVSDTESTILWKGASGNLKQTIKYTNTPYVIELYDGPQKINSGTYSASCATGGWSESLERCVDPQVTKTKLIGEYYAVPGTWAFTCKDSDAYVVKYGDNDTIVASGTYNGEVFAPLTVSGNYAVRCFSGTISGTPVITYYNSPPPPNPKISFVISPRTISKNDTTVLAWTIDFPKDTCTLSAKVLCKNNSCNPAQTEFETNLNQRIQTESTDEDDPATSREILYSLKNIAPGHMDEDWKALGTKTFSLLYTTDFLLSCGDTFLDKKRVYVRGEK